MLRCQAGRPSGPTQCNSCNDTVRYPGSPPVTGRPPPRRSTAAHDCDHGKRLRNGAVSMTASGPGTARLKVVVVAGDPGHRAALGQALRAAPDIDVLAWADSAEPLAVLGTRADVCL